METTKVSDNNIKSSVLNDMKDRNNKSVERLKEFYYKIIIEDTIRTTSFRYHHAKTALVALCESTGDTDTIENLKSFHDEKLQFEAEHPVKKDDVSKQPASNKKSKFDSSVRVDKSAAQIKLK